MENPTSICAFKSLFIVPQKMKEIKNILTVLNSNNLEKELALGDFIQTHKSLLSKLAFGIITDKYQTDYEAMNDLYGNVGSTHVLRLLKSKLNKRALSSLLMTEITNSNVNKREAMKHEMFKELIQVNLLLQFGSRTEAIKLLKRVLANTDAYSVYEPLPYMYSLFRMHYWYVGDQKQFNYASSMLEQSLTMLSNEYKAEEQYQRCTIFFVKSKYPKASGTTQIKSAIRQISKFERRDKSFVITSNLFKLRILLFQVENEHSKVIAECHKALKYLKDNKDLYNNTLQAYLLLTQCESFEQKHMHKEVIKTLPQLRLLIKPHSPNILLVERLAAIAYLRLKDHKNAMGVVKEVYELPYFKIALPHQREEFQIIGAYSELVMILCSSFSGVPKLSAQLNASILRGKMKSSTSDKLGNNIHLIILRTVCYIAIKDFEKLSHQDKIIDNYLYRYIN